VLDGTLGREMIYYIFNFFKFKFCNFRPWSVYGGSGSVSGSAVIIVAKTLTYSSVALSVTYSKNGS
jgi:hypothetical protein